MKPLKPYCRKGLSIVEILVCVVILSVLLAVTLPALSKSRRSMKAARALSDVRQYATALAAYTTSQQERLPFFAIEQRPELGTIVEGNQLQLNYFSQAFFVVHALVPTYLPIELPTGKIDGGDGQFAQLRSTGVLANRVLLTHAAAADPTYWDDDQPPVGVTYFRQQSAAICAFPSQKVSLYNSESAITTTDYAVRNTWMGAMFDGSASTRVWSDPISTSNPRPLGAFPALGMSTRYGLRGIDW